MIKIKKIMRFLLLYIVVVLILFSATSCTIFNTKNKHFQYECNYIEYFNQPLIDSCRFFTGKIKLGSIINFKLDTIYFDKKYVLGKVSDIRTPENDSIRFSVEYLSGKRLPIKGLKIYSFKKNACNCLGYKYVTSTDYEGKFKVLIKKLPYHLAFFEDLHNPNDLNKTLTITDK